MTRVGPRVLLALAILAVGLDGPRLLAVPAECPGEDVVRPGRWLVESRRDGEPAARGRADVQRLDGGCIVVERLILHFEDGTSHHVVFVRGADPANGMRRMVQVGDHPLFLVWERQDPSTARYRTMRRAEDGNIELEWRMRSTTDGFRRELRVRRPGEADWTSSEVITYTPLPDVTDPSDLPALAPGPFHDPDACTGEEFRAMDYLLGHWLNEEWTRRDEQWTAASVSDVSVRSVIGGCALLEDHPIYEDGVPGDRLLLLRGYDARTDRWRQVVFGYGGGVWEWDVERAAPGWLLTPVGEMAGQLRIIERQDAEGSGFTKRIERRGDDGAWRVRRLIRYVPW